MQSHAAWKRLTETIFLSPVVDYLPASKTVPTPKAILGDIAGAAGKLPYSKEVRDVNEIEVERLTFGQRAADRVAAIGGSWWFIGTQSAILLGWAWLNLMAWTEHWDPYPFILMNLFLSLQAAYTAPMLMMSQNRLAARDRLEAHNDYEINRKAEEEVKDRRTEVLRHVRSAARPSRESSGNRALLSPAIWCDSHPWDGRQPANGMSQETVDFRDRRPRRQAEGTGRWASIPGVDIPGAQA
jgi:uncharacterized membrane protein